MGMLFFALIGAQMIADPLAEAESRFQALSTYQVTVRSTADGGERQEIRYFYRKPGWVRMEFVQPHHGAVLIYDPGALRLRLWPFGVKRFPALTLSPDNPLVGDRRGHRVDRSDVGALLANLQALRSRGSVSQLGETDVAGRAAIGLDISGEAGVAVAGVHRYRVWLARDTLFPLRVESYTVAGKPIESVEMTDPQIDVAFPDRFFTP